MIGPVDAMWLNMDRPENLMVIDSVLWTDEPVDWERLIDVIQRRMLDVYPVFSQRPRDLPRGISLQYWEDDPEFDLKNHIVRATLDEPADAATLQRYVESQMHVPFDRAHPLWQFHFVDGYAGGSAVVTRFHHALADGIALAQVLLSLTDDLREGDLAEESVVLRQRRPGSRWPDPGALVGRASSAVRGGLHMLSELPSLAQPGKVLDVLNMTGALAQVVDTLITTNLPANPLKGPLGIHKRAVWSNERSLSSIKRVGRALDATVNDVVIAAVSGALHTYLADHGFDPMDLSTMVPVNIRPPGEPLPRTLGNRFALVFLPLPIGSRAPLLRVAESKRRMDVIKISPMAMVTFGVISATGLTDPHIERYVVDYFAAKAFGVTTNVMGPGRKRYLAGASMEGTLGWVPGSGRQTTGICIFSYNGKVRVGFKTDATVVPDAEKLVAAFDAELNELIRIARGVEA